MPPENSWFEQPGDELRDEEFPDEDPCDDDLSETVACPECGAEVYEDAVRCPVCGTYIPSGSGLFANRPGWWIAVAILLVLALILLSFGS